MIRWLRLPRRRIAAVRPCGARNWHLLVVLTPSVGHAGYEAVDVADQEPWSGMRG